MKVLSKPSGQRLKNRAIDYGSGVGAALLMNALSNWLGSNFWGSAISAVVVGSILPDDRGTTITTMLGFTAGMSMSAGGGGNDTASDAGVM
jgi:hypothetical protein